MCGLEKNFAKHKQCFSICSLHLRIKFLNYKRKEIIAEERRKKIENKKEEARKEKEMASDVPAVPDAALGGPAAAPVAGPAAAPVAGPSRPTVAGPSGASARPSLPPSAARRHAVKTKQWAKR